MEDFNILEQDGDKIISLKRISDGVVFTVGDNVDLINSIEEGTCDGFIIQKFMTENDRTHNNMDLYKTANPFPKGTIVTEKGTINILNAGHTDFTTDMYKIMNTSCFSIRDILRITNFKHKKAFQKLAKEKLSKINN